MNRLSRSVLPPSESRLRGLVPVAASPVPTNRVPLLAISRRQPPCCPVVDGMPVRSRRSEDCPRGVLREAPGHHAYVVPAAGRVAALAGVEALVLAELRVDGQPHQAGLAARPDRCRREADPLLAVTRCPQEQALGAALGDQQATTGDRLHVPRDVEAADDAGDLQRRVRRGCGSGRPFRRTCGGGGHGGEGKGSSAKGCCHPENGGSHGRR